MNLVKPAKLGNTVKTVELVRLGPWDDSDSSDISDIILVIQNALLFVLSGKPKVPLWTSRGSCMAWSELKIEKQKYLL